MAKNDKTKLAIGKYKKESEEFCNQMVIPMPAPDNGTYCPPLVDRWGLCFNYTEAGTTAYLPCPPMFIRNPKARAFRRCQSDGKWETMDNGRQWTNLTDCIRNETLPTENYHETVSYIYLFMVMSALSIILLTISLAIFYGFRQLRCDRITIHKNLFISYLLSAITWIVYYRLVILEGSVIIENPGWCQWLNALGQTFTATSFSWMFCEGLYLHVIMVHALRTGKKLIKCLVVGGWVVPIILAVIYGIVRWAVDRQTKSCWIVEDALQWIINAPVVLSVFVNICILVNLVRLLMTKLRQIPDASQSKKAAKATLILVPLFGLQYLVMPMRPDNDSDYYLLYLHLVSFLQSSQGIWVSVIMCFCNGEVRSLIRQRWNQHRRNTDRGRKSTGGTTVTVVEGYSMVDTTRDGTSIRSKSAQGNNLKDIEAMEIKNSSAVIIPLVPKDKSTERDSCNTDD